MLWESNRRGVRIDLSMLIQFKLMLRLRPWSHDELRDLVINVLRYRSIGGGTKRTQQDRIKQYTSLTIHACEVPEIMSRLQMCEDKSIDPRLVLQTPWCYDSANVVAVTDCFSPLCVEELADAILAIYDRPKSRQI